MCDSSDFTYAEFIKLFSNFSFEFSKTHARSPKHQKVTESKPGQTDSPAALYLETQQTSSTRKKAEQIGSESPKPQLQVELKKNYETYLINYYFY